MIEVSNFDASYIKVILTCRQKIVVVMWLCGYRLQKVELSDCKFQNV